MTCSRCSPNIGLGCPDRGPVAASPPLRKQGHRTGGWWGRSKVMPSQEPGNSRPDKVKHSFLIQILKCEPTSSAREGQPKGDFADQHKPISQADGKPYSNSWRQHWWAFLNTYNCVRPVIKTFPSWSLNLVSWNPIKWAIYRYREELPTMFSLSTNCTFTPMCSLPFILRSHPPFLKLDHLSIFLSFSTSLKTS